MDRMTDRESNTLATCGLDEPFFQLCCCVSFLFWWEIGFGFTYYVYVLKVQYSCGVVLVFFNLAGDSFWCYVRTSCTIQLCGCVSFLVVVGNSFQNENMFLQKNLIGLLYYDPLADVCIL
jgi:hypothetical protein